LDQGRECKDPRQSWEKLMFVRYQGGSDPATTSGSGHPSSCTPLLSLTAEWNHGLSMSPDHTDVPSMCLGAVTTLRRTSEATHAAVCGELQVRRELLGKHLVLETSNI